MAAFVEQYVKPERPGHVTSNWFSMVELHPRYSNARIEYHGDNGRKPWIVRIDCDRGDGPKPGWWFAHRDKIDATAHMWGLIRTVVFYDHG